MQHTYAHLYIYCIGVVWPIHCELNLTRSFMLDTNVYTMCNLYMGFTQLMTESFISEFPSVERYFWTMVNQPNFKKVLGEVKQISLSFLLQRSKYLSQKNLQYQSLRMNPKRRNQQSPNQNLVRKRRKSKGNVAIHNVDCCITISRIENSMFHWLIQVYKEYIYILIHTGVNTDVTT